MNLTESAKVSFDTPEGVALEFELAGITRRAFAFCIDFTIITFAIIFVAIFAVFVSIEISTGWFMAAYMLFVFLLRNFYFVFGEINGRGQTWGKKLSGVRVIDLHGRPLSGNALFLRNVTRDMELFLPLIAIFYPEAVVTNAPWWAGFISLFWACGIGIVPLLHPLNQRVGDMIAGTVVVLEPKTELLDDVGSVRASASHKFEFTNEQLDMYGIYELQVLEDVFREGVGDDAMRKIVEKITNKINWTGMSVVDSREFLDEFYVALRKRLEHRMLLGDRQEHKREGRLGDGED